MSYRVCVTGGYPINRGHAPYEAEAIVTIPGGRVVKRFVHGGSRGKEGGGPRRPERKRAHVERLAQEWIAEHS
jgi:hypothetical protein